MLRLGETRDNRRRIRTQTHAVTVAAAVTVALSLVVAFALPALILCLVTPTDTDLDSESIMVVRYACMACQSGSGTASYFTTYQAAAVHYARSAPCNQSVRGIATVVLPSRPSDVEAGGSRAAEAWAASGPPRRGGPVRRKRLSQAGDFNKEIIKHHDFTISLNHKNHDLVISLNHSFCLYHHEFHGFSEISWYQETRSAMISYT